MSVKSMSRTKKAIMMIVFILAVVFIGTLYTRESSTVVKKTQRKVPTTSHTPTGGYISPVPTGYMAIPLEGIQGSLQPREISVAHNSPIAFVFESKDATYRFTNAQLAIDSGIVKKGERTVISFIASKPGVYKLMSADTDDEGKVLGILTVRSGP